MHARPSRPDARAARRNIETNAGRRDSAARPIHPRATAAPGRAKQPAVATGNGDRGRLVTAGMSAIVPGLGQLAHREIRLAAIFAVPVLALAAFIWLLVQLTSPSRVAASLIVPSALSGLLVLNGLVLLWRLASVGQAFLDARYPARPGGRTWIGLALIMMFVAAPHAYGAWIGSGLQSFGRVFQAPVGAPMTPTEPGTTERLNILLIGVDAAPGRTALLTDTLMVASLDPVGETLTMLSLPRDLVNVPMSGSRIWAPKLNSLMNYANRNPDEFPEGGTAALREAVGTLLGIPIHHHALVDMAGFVKMVDAVGGVDVDVARDLNDPKYDGFGGERRGWSIRAGRHHLDGQNALAYARIRRSAGESDFTRAQRQQQILVAIRNAAVRGDTLLLRVPALLEALGDTVRTDLPPERLPALAGLAEEIDADRTVRIVLRDPLVTEGTNDYGSVEFPDIAAIRAVAAAAFTEPGVPPAAWPTRRPTTGPAASAQPSPQP